MYYSRKYAVHNLYFYESITRSGFCFVWGESEGDRGANEIATILEKYVKDVDDLGSVKSRILYSDSCPGQKKNRIVLSALHNCQLVRNEPRPYNVEGLIHKHFESFEDLADKYFSGNLTGKIRKLRIATFKKSAFDTMKIKYT